MRIALAFGIALLATGPVLGAQAPETDAATAGALSVAQTDSPILLALADPGQPPPDSTLRASVPRATGNGLTGLPVPGGGMSPGTVVLVAVLVGGLIAVIANGNRHKETPVRGTGSGSGGG